MIVPIQLSLSNAYLIIEQGAVLVDSGSAGDFRKIARTLADHQLDGKDLKLILHTHGHSDHAGSSAALRKLLTVPLAVHRRDADMLSAGRNRALINPTRLEARLLAAFINRPFEPCQPDILIENGMDLTAYGIEGQVILTPGHTHGSLTVLLKDGSAISGDLFMSGTLGGRLRPSRPYWHYFYEDLAQAQNSLKNLTAMGAVKFYPGHGAALEASVVRRLL